MNLTLPGFELPAADAVTQLSADDGQEASWHQWAQREIDAVTVARAAGRPLLLRGDPGTGKTQLARAVARALGWRLLTEVIHPRYEAGDLVCRFDAVKRLADAQAGHKLNDAEYWQPGPLWQAYDWATASTFGNCRGLKPAKGCVILIDEIDKADSDLPNSMLGVLGQRRLYVPALGREVGMTAPQDQGMAEPLIVLTTNEERELPAAFLRRCVVLNLDFDAELGFERWLVQRGQAHFGRVPARRQALLTDDVMQAAAAQLADDWARAVKVGLPPPGAAEYLDLLRVLHCLAADDADAQRGLIAKLSAFVFVKNAHHAGDGMPSQGRKARAAPGLTVDGAGASSTARPRARRKPGLA